MDLQKLGIRDIPKWLERNTEKAHLKGNAPQMDILILEDHEGVRKNMEIVHLEKR